MRACTILLAVILIMALAFPAMSQNTLGGLLKGAQGVLQGQGTNAASDTGAGSLTTGEVNQGLKTALDQAIEYAISRLGAENGFLGNDLVRIPVPRELSTLAAGLEAAGQRKLVDDFLVSMNRAAEKAVPATAEILGQAVQDLTMADAQAILQGSEDAATRHFEKTSRPALHERIEPIVAEAMDSTRVTYFFDLMREKSGGIVSLLTRGDMDLDQYVTTEALDGLFLTMAEEEADIRANPLAQPAGILQKVFGSIQ